MKKKGVTLIETIVSMMILTLIITILVSLVKDYKISLKARITKEKLSRISYCIMNEIKYNYSIESVKQQANNNIINIKNYDDILEELKYRNLFELDYGNGIEILVNNDIDDSLKIRLIVSESGDIVEREFVKWR